MVCVASVGSSNVLCVYLGPSRLMDNKRKWIMEERIREGENKDQMKLKGQRGKPWVI